MKTIKYIIIIHILMVVPYNALIGQDHHFSQFDATYQYLNPSLTGMSWDGTYEWRANSSYRSQWGAIASKPFTNQLIAYDMPFKEFGVGALIYNNRAGAGNLNTLNFMLSGAYEITIDPTNRHNLYGGVQLGILHRSIKVSNLLFDSQYSYSAGTYDPEINSGENIGDKSLVKFDANIGFFYKFFDNHKKLNPYGGLSLFHCTKPDESFTSLKCRIPIRWLFTGGTDYIINEEFTLIPSFLFMYEAKATDIVIGTNCFYNLKETDYKFMSGLSMRFKDALIIHAGIQYQSFIFRMSYDLNISYLKNYSNLKGGLEFSAVYVFNPTHTSSRVSY
ncbi:MAG: PorP/SprF family type IX secretion system membrane protein [Bacteroidota bacterium]